MTDPQPSDTRMTDPEPYDTRGLPPDEAGHPMFQPEVVVPALHLMRRLAGDQGALEFGVGTGRLAIPLARRGVPVHGIDISAEEIDRLRAKPGGDAGGVTVGDYTTTRVEGRSDSGVPQHP